METKFKVGEKVRVKKDIKSGTEMPNGLYITEDMEKRAGSIVTIKYIVPKFSLLFCDYDVKGTRYKINEDDGNWSYDDNILEKLELMKLKDLQFGDIITLRNGERYVYSDGYIYGEKGDYISDCNEVTDYYNEDLEYIVDNSENGEYDIVKVERNGNKIFELEDKGDKKDKVKEMTLKEICEELGYEVKVIKENK